MLAYSWPGNVRELQNRVRRAVLLAETPLLEMDTPDDGIRPVTAGATSAPAVTPLRDETLERENIMGALKAWSRAPGTGGRDAECQPGDTVPEDEEIRHKVGTDAVGGWNVTG